MFYSNDFYIKRFGPEVRLLGGGEDIYASRKKYLFSSYKLYNNPYKIKLLKHMILNLKMEYILFEYYNDILYNYLQSLTSFITSVDYDLENYNKYSYEYLLILKFNTIYKKSSDIEMYLDKTDITCQEYLNILKSFNQSIFPLAQGIRISDDQCRQIFQELAKMICLLEEDKSNIILNELEKNIKEYIPSIEEKVLTLKKICIEMLNKAIHVRIQKDYNINIFSNKSTDMIRKILNNILLLQKKKHQFLLDLSSNSLTEEIQKKNLEEQKIIYKIGSKNKYIDESIAPVYISIEKVAKYYTSLAVINDHQVFWCKNIKSYYTLYKLYISKYLTYQESLNDDTSLDKVDKVRILYNIVNNEKNITFCCDKIVENFTLLVNSIEDYNEYSHNIFSL